MVIKTMIFHTHTIHTFFVLLTLTSNGLSQPLKSFGESCSGDCDERLGLICSKESNQCECMLSNATIFDHDRSHCVTKAGVPCRRIVTSSSSTDNLCVAHASCVAFNLNCECDRNYFQTRNGTCAPVAKYGEPCTSRKPCDKSAGMECTGSKSKQYSCQCKYLRDQYYDTDEEKCISYAGGNCSYAGGSFTLPCVKNAKCSQDIFELRRGETPNGKSYTYNATVGRKCSCTEGFRSTKKRQCYPSYQTPCGDYYDNTNNNVCNPEENLKCFDNKICLCQNPLHQLYSLERNKCLNLVGTKCNASPNELDCVENADCGTDKNVCNCKTGFSPTPSRNCLKDFGERCTNEQQCNLFKGLSCQNGTCNCIDDFLKYSPALRSCLSGQGSPCGDFFLEETSNEKTKKVRFIMEMNNNNNYYASAESAKRILKRMTIECDSDQGLNCQIRDGYHQCV